jgi:hypothetical protein
MNLRLLFLGCVALLAGPGRFYAAPAESTLPPGPVQAASSTNASPATPAPPQANAKSAPGANSPNGANGVTPQGAAITKAPNTPTPPTPPNAAAAAPAPAAAPTQAPSSVLNDYLAALDDKLKLSADEKKDIQTYYLADGQALDRILNDPTLSPLQQDQQVSDLRDHRNAKIGSLLADVDRNQEFLEVESQYRVPLIESAADGGLLPAEAPPPVPAPSGISPGAADPTPDQKHPAP